MPILESFLMGIQTAVFILSLLFGCAVGAIVGLIASMFLFDWICRLFFYLFR